LRHGRQGNCVATLFLRQAAYIQQAKAEDLQWRPTAEINASCTVKRSLQNMYGEISGSHSGKYEDDCLLGYSLVEVCRLFRGAYYLHHRPDDGGIKHL
jgi:hypothetical protein